MAQEDLNDSFKYSTETLSSQVRYVNYSLIAVVWILSGSAISGLTNNGNGLILCFIILSLFLDLCQYIWNTVTILCYQKFARKNDLPSQKSSAPVFYKLKSSALPTGAPKFITYGSAVFFFTKLASCLTACVLLGWRLIN